MPKRTKNNMQNYIPVTGIPAHAEYHEFEKRSWFKGFIIRNQTTIRLRRHHMELLQSMAEQLPLYLPRKMDLSRWKFGHAGLLIRSLARIQLRDQLVECNAPPAVFHERQPKNREEAFVCCFQTAKRCEVDLNLDRLRDTMLDVLILRLGTMRQMISQDAAFCSDREKQITDWIHTSPPIGRFGCEEYFVPPLDMCTHQIEDSDVKGH